MLGPLVYSAGADSLRVVLVFGLERGLMSFVKFVPCLLRNRLLPPPVRNSHRFCRDTRARAWCIGRWGRRTIITTGAEEDGLVDERRTHFRENISRNGYQVVRPLGYGAFGHVTLCTDKKTNGQYAIKTQRIRGAELAPDQADMARKEHAAVDELVNTLEDGLVKSHFLAASEKLVQVLKNAAPKEGEFRLYNGRLVRRAIAESEILERVTHCPFVISKKAHFLEGKDLYLVTELIEGGSLKQFLRSQPCGRIAEDTARFFCAELVVALFRLGLVGVAHRDIKPSNIMLDRDGHIKVMDFGLATVRRKNLVLVCGTPEYIPPEVLMQKSWEAKTLDWYALGVLLYQLLYGKTPFEADTAQGVFMNVMLASIEFPKDISVSEEAKSLVLGLVSAKPESRLSATQVMKHPWFDGIDWVSVENKGLIPPHQPGTDGSYIMRKSPVLSL